MAPNIPKAATEYPKMIYTMRALGYTYECEHEDKEEDIILCRGKHFSES